MSHYRINAPKVIHQIFETEVVAVNLESGSYYSIEGAGIDLWRLLEAQRSDAEVFETEIARKFLSELTEEALIVAEENTAAAPVSGVEEMTTRDLSVDPPRLRKFTDMRDLLLLDPIHELDEGGWPQRGQAQPQT